MLCLIALLISFEEEKYKDLVLNFIELALFNFNS
jgi:hypothetical protein